MDPDSTSSLTGQESKPYFECSWARTGGQLLATKIITRNAAGVLFKTDYDKARYLRYYRRDYSTLAAFAEALEAAAREKQVFLIRGQLKPGLNPATPHRRIFKLGDPEATLDGPARQWGVFDLDGAYVPGGLSFFEQCLLVREQLLPAEFRDVRMVAAVTPSTGLGQGLHARLYFALDRPIENHVLTAYATELAAAVPNLRVDPSVFRTGQPIYTARPLFQGMRDPVPSAEWLQVLPGGRGIVALDLERYPVTIRLGEYTPRADYGMAWKIGSPITEPQWLVDLIRETTGRGIVPPELTPFGEHVLTAAYHRIVYAPPGGRYPTLNREAFSIGQFLATEIPPGCAKEVLMAAAVAMRFNDKYSVERLEEIIETGLSEGSGRPR
jgi:hypothetical protein